MNTQNKFCLLHAEAYLRTRQVKARWESLRKCVQAKPGLLDRASRDASFGIIDARVIKCSGEKGTLKMISLS